MDCQGCEYKAMVGARTLFDRYGVDIVRAEFDPPLIRANGDSPKALLQFLWQYQFTVYDAQNQKVITVDNADSFIEEREKTATDIVAIAHRLSGSVSFDGVIH